MDNNTDTHATVGGKVLVLDDDPAVGYVFTVAAQRLGMQALAVQTGEEFFFHLEHWTPTHIVLDLIMPEMDGVQVLQTMAELGTAAAICLTSGAGPRVLRAARQSALEHGFLDIQTLPKPAPLAMIDEFLRERNVFAPPPFKNAKHDGPAISESELRRAVSDDQLFLMYQPVIACPRRKLKGFEALIRWQHPQHGLVMPDSFIGIAESTGLIHDITSIVADLSLKWISGSTALNDMTLSINVSAKSLDDKQFPDRLGAAALKAGVSPTKIILEVTETAAASDELLALDLFTRLRVKGFKVSIDDFGIGSSSLALLARLPCSELKVDRSFAMAATESEEARAIIRSTMDLSRNLNLDVVTEGIENQETLDYIEAVGCDFAQGYYIARPMLGEQALDWAISSPYAN